MKKIIEEYKDVVMKAVLMPFYYLQCRFFPFLLGFAVFFTCLLGLAVSHAQNWQQFSTAQNTAIQQVPIILNGTTQQPSSTPTTSVSQPQVYYNQSSNGQTAQPRVQQGQVSHSSSQVVPPSLAGMSAEQTGQTMLKHLLTSNGLSGSTVQGFEIQDEDSLNAATDGKNIYFTRPLWNTLKTDDQRAFVLSHELSHITLNHIPKTIGRQIGFGLLGRLASGVFGNGLGGAVASKATQVGIGLVDLKFSRGAEYDADERGLRFMRNAGYDTQAAVQTLQILQQAGDSGSPEFLRSHPLEQNRINRLANEIH